MPDILIVDNAAFVRSALKAVCEQAGHKVVGMAADGKEAVRLYRELRPDVVTMDILMEGMDGIQALGEIKKYDPNAKVLIVSVISSEAKKEEAIGLGAAGYVLKPFKSSELVEEIARVAGRCRE